jgi:translation initiation factor 1 (eIF-1/SUI1)
VISGLQFETKETTKAFITSIKKKFGIGGCQKTMEDIDKENPVYVFTGDLRDKIIKILVEDYKYDPKLIKKHG